MLLEYISSGMLVNKKQHLRIIKIGLPCLTVLPLGRYDAAYSWGEVE
jgi:hypothetical protein